MVSRRGGVGEELIREAGIALETLDISGLDTSRPLTLLTAAARLPVATLRAGRLLHSFGADVVVGTAGYVCVPVVLAAGLLQVPVVLLEQNAHPGRAIRLLARRARVVAASFAGTAALLGKVRVVHTGNPLRADLVATPPEPLPDAPSRLLLTGGSQGALRLNRALAGCLRRLLERHPALAVIPGLMRDENAPRNTPGQRRSRDLQIDVRMSSAATQRATLSGYGAGSPRTM